MKDLGLLPFEMKMLVLPLWTLRIVQCVHIMGAAQVHKKIHNFTLKREFPSVLTGPLGSAVIEVAKVGQNTLIHIIHCLTWDG